VVVQAAPFAEKLKKNEEESAEECLETVKQGLLGSRVEEVSEGVPERNNRKSITGHSDANTTHSTLGDKNFVQNYFKVSSGQNYACHSSVS
jgi:hypothetical protein